MKVSDELEAVIVLLHGFPVCHRTDVIPEGEVPACGRAGRYHLECCGNIGAVHRGFIKPVSELRDPRTRIPKL